MTRRDLLTALGSGLILGPLATALPAEAGHARFYLGTGFEIGRLRFHLALGHRRHHPGYWYRLREPFSYRQVRCGSRCFHDGDHDYHDLRCPVVHHHFRRHGYDPYRVFDRYAPRTDAYGYDSYDPYERDRDRDRWRSRRRRGYRYEDDDDDRSCPDRD
jgi:hypothetical protein